MIIIFNNSFKSFNKLMLSLNLPSRSKNDILKRYGSFENYFKFKFQNLTDEQIILKLKEAYNKSYFLDKSKYFFVNDLQKIILNNLDQFTTEKSKKDALLLVNNKNFVEALKKYLNKTS